MHAASPVLLPNRKAEQPQYFFSPAFQCYTSPPFYKNLLNDLQYISAFIDQCPPGTREIVWEQLFILLGAKPAKCSKIFGPVLHAWAEAPTINLLAVELLYLAFAISLDKHPDLLKAANGNIEQHRAPSLQLPRNIAKQMNIQQQHLQQMNVQQQHQHQRAIAAQKQIQHQQQLQQKQLQYQHQQLQQQLQQQMNVQQQMHRVQGSNQPRSSPQRQPSHQMSPQQQTHHIQHREEPVEEKPKNETKKPFDFEKLLQLQSWKAGLDGQPDSVKAKIWRIWESLTGSSFVPYEGIKISKTVNTWAKDIATYSDDILSFHSAVECIKNSFGIDLDKPPCVVKRAPPSSPKQNSPMGMNAGHINLPSVTPPHRIQQMSAIQVPQYQTAATPFRMGFDQQQYPTAQLPGTISRTLRPLTRDTLPQKRQMPPSQNDPKRMKQ